MKVFKYVLALSFFILMFGWLFFAPLISPRFKVCGFINEETRFAKPVEQCIKERRDEACAKGFANPTLCDGGVWIGK